MKNFIDELLEKRDVKRLEKITKNLLALGYEKMTVHEGKKLVGYLLYKGDKQVWVEVM